MLRNFLDYNKYIFQVKRAEVTVLVIDLILFIASTNALIKEWLHIITQPHKNRTLIIIILGSMIKFGYDIYKMIDEVKANLDLRYGYINESYFNETYNHIKEVSHNKYEYSIVPIYNQDAGKKEYICESRKINRYLREQEFELVYNKEMEERIGDFIQDNKNQLLPFLRYQYRLSNFYGKMFFNERKFCLSTEFYIEEGKENVYKVGCHKGTYYDTFLTNVISGKELRSNQDNKLIASAKEFMPVRKLASDLYSLKDITTSIMNNEVGVSTLGITSDNYLILWRQNRAAQSSSGLLVPTGSGSADWKDYKQGSLNETIINAMGRELWEENGGKKLGVSYENIGQTQILGYFRWLKKGGKSEFVGVTRLNADLITFSQQKSEVFDREEYLVEDNQQLLAVIDQLLTREDLSVPLVVCLQQLRQLSCDVNKKFSQIECTSN